MYFDMELKPADRPALQTDTGICITYGELREQIAEFRHAVRQRSFVFLLCENTPGAVIGYLGCLNAGAVPLLLNAELDETLLQEMYERYQPEYVWMPKKHAETWKPCNLSEKQNKADENINKSDEKTARSDMKKQSMSYIRPKHQNVNCIRNWHCCWQPPEVPEVRNWYVCHDGIWKATRYRLWSI